MKRHILSFVVATSFFGIAHAQTLSNYQAIVTSQGPTCYFKLDGTLSSSVSADSSAPSLAGGFAGDRFHNTNSSYYFVNATDYLSVTPSPVNGGGATNLTSTKTGSITFLFRTLDAATNTGQRFIFSGGNNATNGNALSLFLENTNAANTDTNSLKFRFGNNTTTILLNTNILPNAWYYFAMTYSEARSPDKAHWFVGPAGGTLVSGVTTNSPEAVAGEAGTLFLGNKDTLDSAFRNPGSGRLDEFAVFNRELTPLEISNQFSKLPQVPSGNLLYSDAIKAELPAYFFELNNSFTNSVGPALTLSNNGPAGTFVADQVGNANSAFSFTSTTNGLVITNDLINGGGAAANASAAGSGSLTFLFRSLGGTNNAGQRYLFGQGAGTSGNANQFGCFFENTNVANGDPNSLKLRLGNGPTTTILSNQFILTNTWYYFAMTWDETRDSGEVKYYLAPVGTTLKSGTINIGNTAVIGDNGTLIFGNRATLDLAFANPGTGAMDSIAIWNDELQLDEITAQYNAVLNVSAAAPALGIQLSSPNVILSWPSSTDASYALESSPTLAPGSWSGAGAAAVSGTNYVVTNGLSGIKFYRLHKP